MCQYDSQEPSVGFDFRKMVVAVQRTVGAVGLRQDEATTDYLCRTVWFLLMNRVERAALKTDQPNWHEQVLERIVTLFPAQNAEEEDDVNYTLLTLCVVFMAYDIVRVCSDGLTSLDRMFILNSLGEVLNCDLGGIMRMSLMIELDAEHERLVEYGADYDVIDTVSTLKSLLVEVSERMNLCTDSMMSSPQTLPQEVVRAVRRFTLDDEESLDSDDDALFNESPFADPYGIRAQSRPGYTGHVHVQVYLKPRASLHFPCVQSAKIEDEILTVQTRGGLTMYVEEGVTVSGIGDPYDSMKIFEDSSTGPNLCATVMVPPESMYLIEYVIPNGGLEPKKDGWTEIETSSAWIRIGNGEYHVEPLDSYVMVHNCNSRPDA
jgi:hypothetical protein